MNDELWTAESKEQLVELYPTYTNKKIAEMLGYSIPAIKRMASQMKLRKAKPKSAKSAYEIKEREEFIRENFRSMPTNEIAQHLGVSKTTVRRIASGMSLKRTTDEMVSFLSSKRTNLISRERRRLVYGFEPISDIKIVTNRKMIICRYQLKKSGYMIDQDRRVIYYTSDHNRNISLEKRAIRNGLKLVPLETETNFYNEAI